MHNESRPSSSGQHDLQREQLDHAFAQARRHGRWLADDEIAALEQQRLEAIERLEQQRLHRRKLVILTVVCVLIPPFWPLALGLVLYLLFPKASKRFGLIAGLVLLAIGALLTALLVTLLVVLLLALV